MKIATKSLKLKKKIIRNLNKIYKQKCLLIKQAELSLEFILLYLESALEKTDDYNKDKNSVYVAIGCCFFYLFIFLAILYYFLK